MTHLLTKLMQFICGLLGHEYHVNYGLKEHLLTERALNIVSKCQKCGKRL